MANQFTGDRFTITFDTVSAAEVPVTKIELGAAGSSDGFVSSTLPLPVGTYMSAVTTGAKSSISTSALQITASSIACKQGVLVKAASGNSGTVWVGPSTVTAGTADATDGIELLPGDAVTIPIDNANKVYVIGSAAGQKVYWMAL